MTKNPTDNVRQYHREWRRKQKAKERIGKTVDGASICCRICQQVVGAKGVPMHLRMHGIIKEDYIMQYLDDFKKFGWQLCEICKTLTKGPTCSRECMYKYRSIKWKKEGKDSWNAGLTKDTSELLVSIGKKVSKANTRNPKIMGDNNSSKRPEVRSKMSETRKRLGLSAGKNNPMYGKTHTHEAIKKIIRKRSMTSIEQIAAKSLDGAGIEYYSQFFLRDDGKTYAYDFKIKGRPIIIEIDGDYWHGGPGCDKYFRYVDSVKRNDNIKNRVAQSQGFLVIRVWGSEMKQNTNALLERIE